MVSKGQAMLHNTQVVVTAVTASPAAVEKFSTEHRFDIIWYNGFHKVRLSIQRPYADIWSLVYLISGL